MKMTWFAGLFAFIILLSGCESVNRFFNDNQLAYDATVRIATSKVIDGDSNRAERAAKLAEFAKDLALDRTTIASEVVTLLRAEINWQSMDNERKILVNEFLVFLDREINRSIDLGEIQSGDKFLISHTADLVIEVASRYE